MNFCRRAAYSALSKRSPAVTAEDANKVITEKTIILEKTPGLFLMRTSLVDPFSEDFIKISRKRKAGSSRHSTSSKKGKLDEESGHLEKIT
jgi:hypothetical protein